MSRSLPISCLVLLVVAGCASSKVLVPPRLDLAEWPTIGIVEFTAEGDPELASLATVRFVEMLQQAQPGARILELGPQWRLLAEVGGERLDFEAVRALGERYRVDAVFTGALELSQMKPNLSLGEALTSLRASANVNGQLATRLLETRSGAIVWSRSARASENVARLRADADGSLPSFRIGDPADAGASLVPQLVSHLAADFYPSWQ